MLAPQIAMFLAVILHGPVGILDELIACGMILAFGLAAFFLTLVFGKSRKS